MVRLDLIVAGLFWAGSLLLPASASAESIASAVERAILKNPEVRAAYLEHFAIDAGIDAAIANRKPKLGVTAQGGVRGDEDKKDETYGFSVALTQSLYDAGETTSQIRRSKAETRAADSRYEDTMITIGLHAVQAYIEVQRSRRILDISQRNLKSLLAIQKHVKLRASAGFSNGADLFQAKARIEGAREQLATARQQHADAVAEYRILIGQEPGKLESAGAPEEALPRNADEAVQLASRRSPKIMAVAYDAIAADAAADAIASAAAPRLNLKLSLDYDAAVDGFSEGNQSGAALIVFRYDLDDGGTRKARERQARYRAKASQQDAMRETQSVEREIRLSWNAIQGSRARLQSLKQHTAAAGKSLSLNMQRFAAGMASLETLLSLQDEAAASEVAYANELSSGRFNVYRVLAGTGRLLPALGKGFSSIDSVR